MATPSGVAGTEICEHMPLLAQMADKYSIIRSLVGMHEDHSNFHTQTGWGRNELRNVESQFQGVWQPLQQAYDQVMNKRAELEQTANGLGGQVQAHNNKPHVFTLPQEQPLLDAYDAEASWLRQQQENLDRRIANELQPLTEAMKSQADRVQNWLSGPTLTNFESNCRRALSIQQDGPAMRQLKQADQQGHDHRAEDQAVLHLLILDLASDRLARLGFDDRHRLSVGIGEILVELDV